MNVVTLNPSNESRVFNWMCPQCNCGFTWSKSINRKFGHPEDKAF